MRNHNIQKKVEKTYEKRDGVLQIYHEINFYSRLQRSYKLFRQFLLAIFIADEGNVK